MHNLNPCTNPPTVIEEPLIVLGNHDVRRDGYLEPDLSAAFRFKNEFVRWIDDSQIGLACFNPNLEARSDWDLATGKIGKRQFQTIGNVIDRKGKSKEYVMIALLHHHPIPVPRPDWYDQPLTEKIFGTFLARTVELRDAKAFNAWVLDRKFSAVLHGHEHIPRFTRIYEDNAAQAGHSVAIVGCGSSVGKVRTNSDEIYASLNIININKMTSQITARLAAWQIEGGKLKTTHEYVHKC